MLQIGQSHPTGLTTNLLKLFEPRAPLEFRPPPEKRKCPPYQGMASVNFVLFWFIFSVWSCTSFPSLHEGETLCNGGSLLREHLCFHCYAAAYFLHSNWVFSDSCDSTVANLQALGNLWTTLQSLEILNMLHLLQKGRHRYEASQMRSELGLCYARVCGDLFLHEINSLLELWVIACL